MIKNYFLTAWRNLKRHKTFSFINILGLGMGVGCSLLIFLWVQDERSFDGFHANGERLYKVMLHNKRKNGDIGSSMDATPGRMAETMKKQFPEVEAATTLVGPGKASIRIGEKQGRETTCYADTDFFRMFSFPLLAGNAKETLSDKSNIVITRDLATRYFGKEDAMGKTIRLNNQKDYRVSGIVQDPPLNSSIRFSIVLSLENCFDENPWMVSGWDSYGPPTYLMLRPGASATAFNAKIKDFISQQDSKITDKLVSVVPYTSTYLYSHFTKGIADGGRIEYVRLFSIIAVFILLIACINFMNLATARSIKRAREVGVRKVIGAGKGRLFVQFIMEAMITALLAVILALGLTYVALPFFNTLTGKQLTLPWNNPAFWLLIPVLILVTGFIAGSYPALFLSALRPVAVLKSALKMNIGATLFRKGLVVFQFTLSIILIISAIIVSRQMQYVQTKNLGLDRENIVYVPLQNISGSHYDAFKNELLASGAIGNLARCSGLPTNLGMATDAVSWTGKDPKEKATFWDLLVDYDFIPSMKITMSQGRNYSRDFSDDSSNFIFNEEAIKRMNMQDPIGQFITWDGHRGKIIGVVKNFHFRSLHENIAPLFIHFKNSPGGLGVLKTTAGKTPQAIAVLQDTWKKFNPEVPLDYIFSDDAYNRQYKSEMMVMRLSNIFAVLAIVISCLGLFGLAMFMAEQRTKEIGIRKVLGAGTTHVVAMLSKDFVLLVLLAALLAFPVAWWTTHQWLQDFKYRAAFGWWIFPLSALLAIAIALGTISFQALKAAMANPVKSLRNE